MLTLSKQVTETPCASVSPLRNGDLHELLVSRAKHNIRHRTDARPKVSFLRRKLTTSVMSSPNTEAKTPGATQTQMKMLPCPSGVLHSHSDIHALCILVERYLTSSNTVIPKGDFLSKCMLPIARKHTEPGDQETLWGLGHCTQELAWLKYPGAFKVSPPRKISHTGEGSLATY